MKKENYIILSILLQLLVCGLLWTFIVWPGFYTGIPKPEYIIFNLTLVTAIILQIIAGIKWQKKTDGKAAVAYISLAIPIIYYGLLQAGNLL